MKLSSIFSTIKLVGEEVKSKNDLLFTFLPIVNQRERDSKITAKRGVFTFYRTLLIFMNKIIVNIRMRNKF